MSVRKTTPDDTPAIARVHVDTWRTTYSGIVPAHFYESMGGKLLGKQNLEIGGATPEEVAYGWEDLRNSTVLS